MIYHIRKWLQRRMRATEFLLHSGAAECWSRQVCGLPNQATRHRKAATASVSICVMDTKRNCSGSV
jgi:hypothetical protein